MAEMAAKSTLERALDDPDEYSAQVAAGQVSLPDAVVVVAAALSTVLELGAASFELIGSLRPGDVGYLDNTTGTSVVFARAVVEALDECQPGHGVDWVTLVAVMLVAHWHWPLNLDLEIVEVAEMCAGDSIDDTLDVIVHLVSRFDDWVVERLAQRVIDDIAA